MFAHKYIFWALLLFSCGSALLMGRRYERIAAAVFLGASILSVAEHVSLDTHYLSIDVAEVLIDSAVLLSIMTIALLSDRFWPLWAAGLQLVDSMAHIFKAVTGNLPPWAYAIAERFWSYPILVILFIGAWRQQQRRSSARKEPAPAR